MDSGFRDWRKVLDDMGLSGGKNGRGRVDVEPLRIAYRSTREVLAVAREILGPLADPTPPLALAAALRSSTTISQPGRGRRLPRRLDPPALLARAAVHAGDPRPPHRAGRRLLQKP